MACLAPLDSKPHPNPARAALGELVFFYTKDVLSSKKREHSQTFSANSKAVLKDSNDLDACKTNIQKAAGGTSKRLKPTPKPKPDPARLPPAERKKADLQDKKDKWSSEVNKSVASLDKIISSLETQQIECLNMNVPKTLQNSVASQLKSAFNHKKILTGKLRQIDSFKLQEFGTAKMNACKDTVEAFVIDVNDKKTGVIAKAKDGVAMMKRIS